MGRGLSGATSETFSQWIRMASAESAVKLRQVVGFRRFLGWLPSSFSVSTSISFILAGLAGGDTALPEMGADL